MGSYPRAGVSIYFSVGNIYIRTVYIHNPHLTVWITLYRPPCLNPVAMGAGIFLQKRSFYYLHFAFAQIIKRSFPSHRHIHHITSHTTPLSPTNICRCYLQHYLTSHIMLCEKYGSAPLMSSNKKPYRAS